MSDWDDSGSNYAGNSAPSNYNSYQEPVYDQSFENSSYQNRSRGGGGRGGRPNNRFDDGGRQGGNRGGFDRYGGGNNGGRRQYSRGGHDGGFDGGRSDRGFQRFGGNDGGRQNDRGFDRYGGNEGGRQYNRDDAVSIKVPSRFVGRIIGKGGSKINDMQYESGAKITVTKEEEDGETIVKLIGSAEATKRAEEMIMELTVDRSGPMRDGN